MKFKQISEARHIGANIDTGLYVIYDSKERMFVDEIGRNGVIRHNSLTSGGQSIYHRFWSFKSEQDAYDMIERMSQLAQEEYPEQAKKHLPKLSNLEVVRLVAVPK